MTTILERVPKSVRIREVGPREGFQNGEIISTRKKADVVIGLIEAGVKTIQHTAFVNPKYTPQWADATAMLELIEPVDGVVYDALVLNRRGLTDAAAARDRGLPVNQISLLGGATDYVLNSNGIPNTVEEDMGARMVPLIRECVDMGFGVIPGVSAAFGCAHEGYVPTERVVRLLAQMVEAGATRVYLGDSTGEATPAQVLERVGEVRAALGAPLNLHLHDNRGQGVACVLALLLEGFDDLEFDTAVGGVGGCQFIDAAGNVATDDVLFMLDGLGVATGISLEQIVAVAREIQDLYDYPLTSHVSHYGIPKWLEEQRIATARA
jgi:hydroxymethylglutaryl-CoA lyase